MGKIKGWTKIEDSKKYPFTQLWRRDSDGSFVEYSHAFKDMFLINIYLDTNPTYNSPTFEKECKNKKAAIAHAMKYMRSHPNG